MEENKKRIIVENISKKFNLSNKRGEGALAKIIGLFSDNYGAKEIQAVKDISFEAMSGENIGIIGKNGSGKSTLLRIIAGIYQPDSGKVTKNGKVLYLSGFVNGLQQKLTMRENIFLVGSINGLRKREIKERFDDIVELSGLEDFLDVKVYKFSSGMITRLNFSISIHCIEHQNPDILLLDEVINAGGDMDFKEKTEGKVEKLIRSGTTVIIVSHNLEEIKKYCDRVILIESGSITETGKPEEIINLYKKSRVTKSAKN